MESYFETYFAQQDADELEDDRVIVRHKGKLTHMTKEEVEALYDSGEDFSVVVSDDDGELSEYPM